MNSLLPVSGMAIQRLLSVVKILTEDKPGRAADHSSFGAAEWLLSRRGQKHGALVFTAIGNFLNDETSVRLREPNLASTLPVFSLKEDVEGLVVPALEFRTHTGKKRIARFDDLGLVVTDHQR